MTERDLQKKLTRWLRVQKWPVTKNFEAKVTKTNSIPFSALAPHQAKSLWLTKHSHLTFKPPDYGNRNPFDCTYWAGCEAYVVVCYYLKRGDMSKAIFIDIDDWIREEKNSNRKSLTKQRALEIGIERNIQVK